MLDRKQTNIPPSGAIAGVYARSDIQRGVHKAPANENINCTGLSCFYNKGEQDILNPAGVNLIRSFPGQGIKIWAQEHVLLIQALNMLILEDCLCT